MENKLKALETRATFVHNPEYLKTNEKLDKITRKTHYGNIMVLELTVNVIATSKEKTPQNFSRFRKIFGSPKSNSKYLNR